MIFILTPPSVKYQVYSDGPQAGPLYSWVWRLSQTISTFHFRFPTLFSPIVSRADRFIHNTLKFCHSSLSSCPTGICVRNVGRYVHMHHKFALVDGRRLITGSLNWTLAAVQCNSENVLVTEEPRLVQPFVREFCRLWADNDPSQNGPF